MSERAPGVWAALVAGSRWVGVVPDGAVTVVALALHGASSATLTYRTAAGHLAERRSAVRRGSHTSAAPVPTHLQPARRDGRAGAQDADAVRAELISPGTPLLTAVVKKVLADHGDVLDRGATHVDPDDPSTEARLLVCLEHTITDGRHVGGRWAGSPSSSATATPASMCSRWIPAPATTTSSR